MSICNRENDGVIMDRPLRIGLITDRSAARIGNEIWTDAPNGRLLAALRLRSQSLTVAFCMAPNRTASHIYNCASCDMSVLEGPYVKSIARGFFLAQSVRRMLRDLERLNDVVIAQIPLAAVTALFFAKKPRVYQVVGDIRSVVFSSDYYRGLKGYGARTMSRFFDACHRRLAHRADARIVAHGNMLLNRYGADRGRAVVSSTIYPEEILSVPRRRPVDAPFRVLYVGYLRHEKGVDVILEAFRRLLDVLPTAELEVIGEKEQTDQGVSDRIRTTVTELSQRTSVRLRGHVPFGPQLFQAYADADVCVIASSGGEGTPRVLIEARAFGCPVIGTAISGIPDSIDDERDGLLFPPGNAEALALAMTRIATDVELKKRLVSQGVERARRTTVNDFADAIVAEARIAAGIASVPRPDGVDTVVHS